jgi:hypothetical protein
MLSGLGDGELFCHASLLPQTLRFGDAQTFKLTLRLAGVAAIWGLWASLSIIPAEKAEE